MRSCHSRQLGKMACICELSDAGTMSLVDRSCWCSSTLYQPIINWPLKSYNLESGHISDSQGERCQIRRIPVLFPCARCKVTPSARPTGQHYPLKGLPQPEGNSRLCGGRVVSSRFQRCALLRRDSSSAQACHLLTISVWQATPPTSSRNTCDLVRRALVVLFRKLGRPWRFVQLEWELD